MAVRTTAPISENQQAIIKKYGFEVFDKNGLWHVNDEVMYRKNALKDASKKGRYQASTLDAALKQAVEVRKEDEGSGHATPRAELTPEQQDAIGGASPKEAEAAKPAQNGKAKPKGRGKKAAEPKEEAEKKPHLKKGERKKDHRFLRAFRVIAADPKVTPEVIANKATMSVKMAGGCILAWDAAMQVLEETKAKDAKTTKNGKK